MPDEDLKVKVNLDTSQFEQGVQSMRRGINGFSTELTRSFSQARRAVNDSVQVFNRLDLAQVTVQQSQEALRSAQERYTDAVERFGANSKQAEKAAHDMEKAHTALDNAQQRSNLSLGLVVAQSAQMAARLPAAVAGMRALAAAQWSATAASGALASAMTAGAAVVGIVAGIMAVKAAVDQASTSFEMGSTKAAEWGTEQMLAALKAREAALMAQADSEVGFLKLGRVSADTENALYDVRSDILQNEFALSDGARNAAKRFLESEDIKAQVAARNEAVIRSELEKTNRTIENARASLTDPFTQTEDLAGLEKTYSDAVTYRKQLSDVLNDISEDSGRAQENIAKQAAAAWQATRDSLDAGLQGFGVNLQALSAQSLESLAAMQGPLGALAGSLATAKNVELNLAAAALKSSKSLRDQTEITAEKDETTSAFHQRLKEFGFTEEEIAKRVDETGRALLRQTEATKKASDAASGYWRSGVQEGTGNGGGFGGHDIGSMGSQGSKFGLQALLEVNRENIISKLWGFPLNSFEFNVNKDKLFNSTGIMQLLGGANERSNTDTIVGARSFNQPGFKELVRDLILTTAPATQWDSLLKELGVPAFANGFEGMVNGPSLFMAGEAGPEHVSVRPMGKGGSGGGQVFNIGPIYARDGDDAGEKIARRLKRLGVFG